MKKRKGKLLRKVMAVLLAAVLAEGLAQGWTPACVKAATHVHDGVTYTEWTSNNSLPSTAGDYCLTDNVELTDRWNVPDGRTTLCLNGKKIDVAGAAQNVIYASSNAELTLRDCAGGGVITGGQYYGINNEGTIYLYGGEISGNGSASSTFGGGGVYNSGTFSMYGGSISGNQSNDGYGGAGVTNYGEFFMVGGAIRDNEGGKLGAGLKIGLMLDVPGTVTVGGSAVITGNNDLTGNAKNLYLANGRTITVDSANPLSGSAQIGITTETQPTEGTPVSITGVNSADYSAYFKSDNSAFFMADGEDHKVQLAAPHTHALTLTAAKDANCTEAGNNAYYTCGCGKWFSDASGTQEITDKDSVIIAPSGHSFDESVWGYQEADGHTHRCRVCDEPDSVEAHVPGPDATETTPQTCTVCGYVLVQALGHTCNPQLVGKTEPGCTTAGKEAYYHCDGCGENYEDEAGTRPVENIDTWGNIAALGHDYGDWTVTENATETTPGKKERTCTRCGQKETEPIPAVGTKPESGTVVKEVRWGVNAPETSLPIADEELGALLLTEEEKLQVREGTDVRIVLEVQDGGSAVSDSDKAEIEKALNGFVVGQYLKIDLYKLVGEERREVTDTAERLRIVFSVPDSLKNTDSGVTRTFGAVRVHDGRAELLEDLDDNENTVTIETDRFSSYAIVSKDTANGGNGDSSDDNVGDNDQSDDAGEEQDEDEDPAPTKDDEPETGDAVLFGRYAAAAAGLGGLLLLLYAANRRRGMRRKDL